MSSVKPKKPAPSRHALHEAQLNRTVLSHNDIGEARQYLQVFARLASTSDEVVRRGLLTAAVVTYCRPFSDNKHNDRATQRLPAKPRKLFSPAQRVLHGKLVELRDTAIAHSAFDAKPISRVSGGLTGFSYWGSNFDILAQGLDVAEWLTMCNLLISHCFTSAMDTNLDMVQIEHPALAGALDHIPGRGRHG